MFFFIFIFAFSIFSVDYSFSFVVDNGKKYILSNSTYVDSSSFTKNAPSARSSSGSKSHSHSHSHGGMNSFSSHSGNGKSGLWGVHALLRPSRFQFSFLAGYTLLDQTSLIELRFSMEAPILYFPFEVMWTLDKRFRIRTWPRVFFSGRKNMDHPYVFFSPYIESHVRFEDGESSHAEIGLGGGLASGAFTVSSWLTWILSQGLPVVQELFMFRTRIKIEPISLFYLLIGARIGPAILRPTTGAVQLTTPGVSGAVELEIGLGLFAGFGVVVSAELYSDNLSGLLEDTAQIGEVTGTLSVIVKGGIVIIF